jgi:hypothetical protein
MKEMGSKSSGHRKRLRDRFVAGDESSRSDVSLLELLLSYAIPQKDVQPLAKDLIDRYGNIEGVFELSIEDLCQEKGIKENTAVIIKLVDWIRQNQKKVEPIKAKSIKIQHTEQTLFEEINDDRTIPTSKPGEVKKKTKKKLSPRKGTGLFSSSLLKETIELLPKLPDTESLDVIQEFLITSLHFNSLQSRKRNANYIKRRMFPDGYSDRALRLFAQYYSASQSLKDVCFYRFLKAEPFLIQIINELFLPNIGSGLVQRQALRDYLESKYPESKSIKHCVTAILNALDAAEIANVNKSAISIRYRGLSLPSFAFVLHSEFPEQDMHEIKNIESNQIFHAMLWNPVKILPALYELRNSDLISKISEIDNVRQFTLKWDLEKIVEILVMKGIK